MPESSASSSPEAHTSASKTDDEKPYHSKRPHKKSRAGCKNCKARKVKCDEARPTCRSCRLRKTECIYPSSSPPKATPAGIAVPIRSKDSPLPSLEAGHSSNGQPSPFPSALAATSIAGQSDFDRDTTTPSFPSTDDLGLLPSIVVEPMYRPAPAVDEIDMRLLWFYTTSTCSSFSIERGTTRPLESLMRTTVVQYAFETPFLMHSLFALASLQLQNLGSAIDPQRSFYYRAKSFEGYRKAVEDANPTTIPALLANSLFLTALSSQTFRDPDTKDLYIIDWMLVWRGIGLMIGAMGVGPMIDAGLNILFYRPVMDLDEATYSIPNNLLFMVSSISTDDPDHAEVQVYYNTLRYLGSLYFNLATKGMTPVMALRIITWFTFVPRRFVELGREMRPRVIVILAYYAMFLKLTTSIWWTAGIGERTLRDIRKHLNQDWADLVRIPLQTISVHDSTKVARIILQDPEWNNPPTIAGLAENEEALASVRKLTWVDNVGEPITWQDNTAVLVNPNDEGSTTPTWSL